MKVLVTGANGFIGSHLVEALVERGFNVRCLVRKTSNLRWIEGLPCEFIYGDITDKDSLSKAVVEVDYIIHNAGIIKAVKPQVYYNVNTFGTENLLEACRKNNSSLKRLVFISSQSASGPNVSEQTKNEDDMCRPLTHYGKSKLKAEMLFPKYSQFFPYTIIRPSIVYGPRDREFFQYIKLINKGITFFIGSPSKKISVIYVKDLIEGIIACLNSENSKNKIYFLSQEKSIAQKELAEIISKILKKRTIKIIVPKWIVKFVCFLQELYFIFSKDTPMLNRDKSNELLAENWSCGCNKAVEDFGFINRFSVEEGLRITIDWYKKQDWLSF